MKKLSITIAVVLVLILLGAGLYFFLYQKGAPADNGGAVGNPSTGTLPPITVNNPNTSLTTPVDVAGASIGSASQIYSNLPTTPQFSIGTAKGTVLVNNFYLSNPPVLDGGNIVFKQAQQYLFLYIPYDSAFWVGINGVPFDAVRTAAEQDLLATLGVSEADACKLNVEVGVVYSPGNPLDGQVFPLSFCSGGVFQAK